jgi:hypothetical protein
MGKHHLRTDKNCENCGYTVDLAYCSNCGQKNVETRQSFIHLITHFAEDFTHYDIAFWKTIKYLLFRPAKLTKEYLAGRRQMYVPPVKLYIFISFVTFFLLIFLDGYHDPEHEEEITTARREMAHSQEITLWDKTYTSKEDFIQKQAALPEDKKLPPMQYKLGKSILELSEKNLTGKQFAEVFFHTMPKALFLYMPFFAFLLWLFHGKKRWYFFDHGIFTLHYFSLLLLLVTLCLLFDWLVISVFSTSISDALSSFMIIVAMLYGFYYFFRSHSRMYGETKTISRLKSLALFIINFIFLNIILIAIAIYTIYHID